MASVVQADDPFAANVRPTEALTPEQAQKSFRLPPGFEMQLFAAEPELQKPMNMAFDTKGRLWVSGSTEYPYAAPLDKPGRDTIKIVEDTDGDGRADKVITFADGLNIPIGLYPYRNGVITFSIPYIYFLEDTDGDDRADERHILFGPLDYTHDTHGMNNAFRRGFDGWIYACHGWSNQDTVAGADGHSIRMEGGATFRFRPDGSRIELFTAGQVNPFGMTIDARGDLFNADCHTKPVTLLLRGGYYESFGKPHDGLGFVPPVMEHLHGSTAIAGTTVYAAENFPAAYRGNMFAGNVMTSRVNRDTVTFNGSSVRATEAPDFVVSDDPWFRPMDFQVGPDGALYVADFYNRIIGHYEVPLDHPGRDRERGRIWRIVYTGDDKDTPRHPRGRDLSTASAEQLIAALGDGNLMVRRLATDALSDRVGSAAVDLLRTAARDNSSPTVRVHSAWTLHRLGRLAPADLERAVTDEDPLVRLHAYRILSETKLLTSELAGRTLAGLHDVDPMVRRAAADALGQHTEIDAIEPLARLILETADSDVHLRHMARIALRNQCLPDGRLAQRRSASDAILTVIADVALAVDTVQASLFLFDYLQRVSADPQNLPRFVEHAARRLPIANLDALVNLAREKSGSDSELQLDLFAAIDRGLLGHKLPLPRAMSDWGSLIAVRLLDMIKAGTGWSAVSTGPLGLTMWSPMERLATDGQKDFFVSSLRLGEQYTGVLRSPAFIIPTRLNFYLCGHLGDPARPAVSRNSVRLKLAATDGLIAEALAPRNDTAQRVDWSLQKYAGQQGYLEIVDGVDEAGFAWIAVGRFEPQVVRFPPSARHAEVAAELVSRLKLTNLRPKLKEILLSESMDARMRGAAAQGLVEVGSPPEMAVLSNHIAHNQVPTSVRNRMAEAIAGENLEENRAVLIELIRIAPEQLQTSVALKLAEQTHSADTLLALVEQGKAPAQLLRNATLVQKLQLAAPPNAAERIQAIVANLPPHDEKIQQLVVERQRNFSAAQFSTAHGRELFMKSCAGCHQLRGQGAIVGPQLDGIGNRGAERIIEDVLDPNRNVDLAFRTAVYALEDGRVFSGLFRRAEGGLTILADNAGKEISFPTDEIAEQRKTSASLMPDSFGSALSPADFNDLIAFLASERTNLDAHDTSTAKSNE